MSSSNQGKGRPITMQDQMGEARTIEEREEIQQKRADLERIIDDVELALDPEYGFNNDELLRLGIGYGIPGPLSDEQVRGEAAQILGELEAS